jgi:hypothetical protein
VQDVDRIGIANGIDRSIRIPCMTLPNLNDEATAETFQRPGFATVTFTDLGKEERVTDIALDLARKTREIVFRSSQRLAAVDSQSSPL